MKFSKSQRKPEGIYLYYCRTCRLQFAVTTKTPLHKTHVPMEKWLEAIAMIKKDSARSLKADDLMRRLGVTRKTANLMCRRLRRGMRGPFIRSLYVALRSYKNPEMIYRNLFPDLYKDWSVSTIGTEVCDRSLGLCL